MKLKKIISLLLSVIMILLMFSSCGYEIVIRKKHKDGDTTVPEAITTVPAVPQDPTAQIPSTTEGNDAFVGYYNGDQYITIEGNYTIAPKSSQEIIDMYKSAMNNVKLRAPGYVKHEYQDVTEVNSFGEIDSQLANRIVDLVATEVLTDSGDEASKIKVLAHDDVAVRKTFPIFGSDTGCDLNNLDIVRSAVCYEDADVYKIVIQFDDQLNPEPYTSDFGRIMTPISRNNLSSGIEEYLVVLDMNQYRFDINYTGNELICIIDKDTNHILNLTQKMIMNVDINLNLDLVLFTTKNIQVKGSIINHLEYYDFDWS